MAEDITYDENLIDSRFYRQREELNNSREKDEPNSQREPASKNKKKDVFRVGVNLSANTEVQSDEYIRLMTQEEERKLRVRENAKRAGKHGARALEKYESGHEVGAFMEVMKLAYDLRKIVDDHNTAPFFIGLIVAMISDFADSTWFIGIFFRVPLFFFLWGRGAFKVRVICRVLLFLDCIPFFGWLPLSTISVLYTWRKSSHEAKRAKKKLKKLELSFGTLPT